MRAATDLISLHLIGKPSERHSTQTLTGLILNSPRGDDRRRKIENEEKEEGGYMSMILKRETSYFLSHDLNSSSLSLHLCHRKSTELSSM